MTLARSSTMWTTTPPSVGRWGIKGRLGAEEAHTSEIVRDGYPDQIVERAPTTRWAGCRRCGGRRSGGERANVQPRTAERWKGSASGSTPGWCVRGPGSTQRRTSTGQGPAVATYWASGWRGTWTGRRRPPTRTSTSRAVACRACRRSQAKSTPGALAAAGLAGDVAFNGVGNLGSAAREQNKYRPATARPYRSVAEQYNPAPAGSGQVLEPGESIGRTVRDASGALVNEPGSGTERYGYDQFKHLVSVTRSAGGEREPLLRTRRGAALPAGGREVRVLRGGVRDGDGAWSGGLLEHVELHPAARDGGGGRARHLRRDAGGEREAVADSTTGRGSGR